MLPTQKPTSIASQLQRKQSQAEARGKWRGEVPHVTEATAVPKVEMHMVPTLLVSIFPEEISRKQLPCPWPYVRLLLMRPRPLALKAKRGIDVKVMTIVATRASRNAKPFPIVVATFLPLPGPMAGGLSAVAVPRVAAMADELPTVAAAPLR